MYIKNALYDWFGLNQSLQRWFHSFDDNRIYHQTMSLASKYVGNSDLFPIHAILIILLFGYVVHRQNAQTSRFSLTKYHSNIIRAGYILCVAFLIDAVLIELCKRYFALPRPFCATVLSDIAQARKCYRSFPSGHAAYITILVMSMWPLMNKAFRYVAVVCLILIYVSRVALNMHFPADIFYSVLMSGTVTYFVGKHIDKISNRFSALNYYMIKFLTKL